MDAEQPVRAIRLALDDAGIAPDQVDYFQAHGSSTSLNEKTETIAIKQVFGDYAYKLPVSSIKSMIGHPLGAAGGMQAVTNCLAIENGIIPPTINYEYPDPDCDLDCVPNFARSKEINIAMHNSAGFSGVNAALVMKKYK